MENISRNIEEKRMVLTRNDEEWWGKCDYKVGRAFIARDEIGRLAPGVSMDNFYRWSYPKFRLKGELQKYEGVKIVMRADTQELISHVGPRSAIMQPDEFACLADDLTQEIDAKAATFVFTDKGQEMAMTLLVDEDKYCQDLISVGAANDNKQTLWVSKYRREVVCQNTRRAAYSDVISKVKMTLGYKDRIYHLVEAVQGLRKFDEWARDFEQALREIEHRKSDRVELIDTLLPYKRDERGKIIEGKGKTIMANKRYDLNQFIINGTGNRDGSWNDVYSGVTEFQSHPERTFRRSTNKSSENAFVRQTRNLNTVSKDADYERRTIEFAYNRFADELPEIPSGLKLSLS